MFLGLAGAAGAAIAAWDYLNGSVKSPASPSTTNEPTPEKDQDKEPADAIPQNPVAAAAPIPPEDPEKDDGLQSTTVRPSKEDIQKLVDEHSDKKGAPLTTEAANKIVDETQPSGTKATIVGQNVAGPDIIYEDANGDRVTSVEVKTGANVDRAEEAVRRALDKNDTPDIVALSIPSDADIPRLMGKLSAIRPTDKIGKRIVAVDSNGNILIELQPVP